MKDLNAKLTVALTIIVVVVLGLIGLSLQLDSSLTKDLNSGKVELHCFFNEGGERKVEPELIEYNEGTFWKFTNGSSNNCRLIEVK